MTPIPLPLRKQLADDPFMKTCIHLNNPDSSDCEGPVTFEHSWIYAGKQIQERWAIVPCCRKHNVGVTGREKMYNQLIALERATPEDLAKYPKKDWAQEKERLIHSLLPF